MNLDRRSLTEVRDPFELPEDVVLMDVWKEVVVDVEVSIELLQQGCNPCGVNVSAQIAKYNTMRGVALQEIEDLTKEKDAFVRNEEDGSLVVNNKKDAMVEPVVLNDGDDGVAVNGDNEDGSRIAHNEDAVAEKSSNKALEYEEEKEGVIAINDDETDAVDTRIVEEVGAAEEVLGKDEAFKSSKENTGEKDKEIKFVDDDDFSSKMADVIQSRLERVIDVAKRNADATDAAKAKETELDEIEGNGVTRKAEEGTVVGAKRKVREAASAAKRKIREKVAAAVARRAEQDAAAKKAVKKAAKMKSRKRKAPVKAANETAGVVAGKMKREATVAAKLKAEKEAAIEAIRKTKEEAKKEIQKLCERIQAEINIKVEKMGQEGVEEMIFKMDSGDGLKIEEVTVFKSEDTFAGGCKEDCDEVVGNGEDYGVVAERKKSLTVVKKDGAVTGRTATTIVEEVIAEDPKKKSEGKDVWVVSSEMERFREILKYFNSEGDKESIDEFIRKIKHEIRRRSEESVKEGIGVMSKVVRCESAKMAEVADKIKKVELKGVVVHSKCRGSVIKAEELNAADGKIKETEYSIENSVEAANVVWTQDAPKMWERGGIGVEVRAKKSELRPYHTHVVVRLPVWARKEDSKEKIGKEAISIESPSLLFGVHMQELIVQAVWWEQEDNVWEDGELSTSDEDESGSEDEEDKEWVGSSMCPTLDLTTELALEAFIDNVRETFAASIVFGDDDLEDHSEWVEYCTGLVEDINRVDNYVAPKLLQMPGHLANQAARLVINLGNLAEDIGRSCRPGFNVMDIEIRREFLLEIEKRVNELAY